MTDVAIRVENLGKQYKLGGHKSGSFRESLSRMFRKPEHDNHSPSTAHPVPSSEFWALKDINFEIKRGEAVGIIGRNGAGKSTLLKILSRITEPTRGRYEIFGRVSSLLEVGTGFHPELTGRENVYLNGTILGMKRREVKAKFDEIVAFSGVEKFIDTPVKHYSSGMKVRLAFSVAAHLEPEILIIDEVLAVGDAEFQKKCLGKMEDVTGEGRTVLFVSHNMGAVQALCSRGICLKSGKILFDRNVDDCISEYLSSTRQKQNIKIANRNDRSGSGVVRFENVSFLIKDKTTKAVNAGDHLTIRLYLKCYKSDFYFRNVLISLGVHNSLGQRLAQLNNHLSDDTIDFFNNEEPIVDLIIPRLPLNQGTYNFTVFCEVNGVLSDWISEAFSLEVNSGTFYKSGKLPPINKGVLLFEHRFEFQKTPDSQLCK